MFEIIEQSPQLGQGHAVTLSPNQAAVLNFLAAGWNSKPKNWPYLYLTNQEISDGTGLNLRQVSYAKTQLRDSGLIDWKLKKANGFPTCHFVHINIDFALNQATAPVVSPFDNLLADCQNHKETNTLPPSYLFVNELFFDHEFEAVAEDQMFDLKTASHLMTKFIEENVAFSFKLQKQVWLQKYEFYLTGCRKNGFYDEYLGMVHAEIKETPIPEPETPAPMTNEFEYPWEHVETLQHTNTDLAKRLTVPFWRKMVAVEFIAYWMAKGGEKTPTQWRKAAYYNALTKSAFSGIYELTGAKPMEDRIPLTRHWEADLANLEVLVGFGSIDSKRFNDPQWMNDQLAFFKMKHMDSGILKTERYWQNAFSKHLIGASRIETAYGIKTPQDITDEAEAYKAQRDNKQQANRSTMTSVEAKKVRQREELQDSYQRIRAQREQQTTEAISSTNLLGIFK